MKFIGRRGRRTRLPEAPLRFETDCGHDHDHDHDHGPGHGHRADARRHFGSSIASILRDGRKEEILRSPLS
jgi:hypothetical protein